MALVCRQDACDPCADLVGIQEELDRFFRRTLTPAQRTVPSEGIVWWPGVDVVEEKGTILVRADLPGLKQEDIEVSIADDVLTIKGERKQTAESKEEQVHRIERSYGTFLRQVALPSGVDATKVGATYKNGVLEVTLPRREEVLPKQVKVDVK